MTLEDFFSLPKMKDGLTAPSRVEELVSIMQKEKDCVVKNIGDATRQWAAIASVIAATENKDCLDLFIQLDGLGFIDRWIKDTQKFANDTNEGIVEESITAMLRALEKLHIDNERSISSGIWITVKSLLGHSSSRVQDRARALLDSWKQGRVGEALDHDVVCVGPSHNDDIAVGAIHVKESSWTESSVLDGSLSKASVNEENNGAETAGAEILPSNSECCQPENAEDVQTKANNNEPCTHLKLDDTDIDDKPPDHLASSKLSNSVPENSFTEEKLPVGSVERTLSVETCTSAPKQCSDEEQSDALKMSELSENEKHVPKVSSFSDTVCVTASAFTGTVEPKTVSSAADVASGHDVVSGPTLKANFDANEGDSDVRATVGGDMTMLASEPKSGMDDLEVTNNCITSVFKSSVEDGECHSDAIQNSSGNEGMYEKHRDLETSFSRIKGIGDRTSDGDSDSRNDSSFSKSLAIRSPNAANKRTSDIELEYGIIDALEVARKVAQEVEREVVDYREQSSSSSEKISGGGIKPPESPDSVNEKQDLVNQSPSKEAPTEQNYSAEAYPEGGGQLVNSDNIETESKNGIADMESFQLTKAAQEKEVNPDKGLVDFDLNQEVCSDDMDHPVNPFNPVSTAVSVVSASRPAAAPGLPAAPLQFEGTLGWKGTAATSAFRPASPRRISDSDKTTLHVGGANNSSKQRLDFLDIDLNVAESLDEKLGDLIPEKQIPVSSSLHSAESSLEMSPKRSERLKLDLNRISDDSDAPPSDLRMETRVAYNRNGHRSPSPASSSSSMQPSLRNIDLNDRPYLHCEFSNQGPYHGKSSQNLNTFGLPKPDDPVISIMGARVEVNRKDFIPQISSLANGKTLDTAMDANLARSGAVLGLGTLSYTHSPGFGYNGFTTAPALSYSSPMYGHSSTIPYMVDTRGAPVVPQIVGSAAAVPPSYSQAPPFIVSMTSASSALNGASRPNFDLNSGFPTEGGNRDSLGLRQLFMPSQGRSMEEQLRASSQPSSSSSGVGGKRKEPDSGWENNQLSYRHQQPPRK